MQRGYGGLTEVWRRELSAGRVAIAVLNRDAESGGPHRELFSLQRDFQIAAPLVDAFDGFTNTPIGTFDAQRLFACSVDPNGVFLVLFSSNKRECYQSTKLW